MKQQRTYPFLDSHASTFQVSSPSTRVLRFWTSRERVQWRHRRKSRRAYGIIPTAEPEKICHHIQFVGEVESESFVVCPEFNHGVVFLSWRTQDDPVCETMKEVIQVPKLLMAKVFFIWLTELVQLVQFIENKVQGLDNLESEWMSFCHASIYGKSVV